MLHPLHCTEELQHPLAPFADRLCGARARSLRQAAELAVFQNAQVNVNGKCPGS